MKISADRKFSYHKAKERRSERTIVLGGRYSGSYLQIIFIAYTRPFNDLRLVELILFDVAIFHGPFFLLRRIWRSNLPLITTNNLQPLSTSVPAGYLRAKSSPYITWKRIRGDKPVIVCRDSHSIKEKKTFKRLTMKLFGNDSIKRKLFFYLPIYSIIIISLIFLSFSFIFIQTTLLMVIL